jgi:hypothetical protein
MTICSAVMLSRVASALGMGFLGNKVAFDTKKILSPLENPKGDTT